MSTNKCPTCGRASPGRRKGRNEKRDGDIRAMFAAGYRQSEIARQFGLTRASIWRILKETALCPIDGRLPIASGLVSYEKGSVKAKKAISARSLKQFAEFAKKFHATKLSEIFSRKILEKIISGELDHGSYARAGPKPRRR